MALIKLKLKPLVRKKRQPESEKGIGISVHLAPENANDAGKPFLAYYTVDVTQVTVTMQAIENIYQQFGSLDLLDYQGNRITGAEKQLDYLQELRRNYLYNKRKGLI